MTTKPETKPEVFEIRTLSDIFELPTIEQVKTCLSEMSQGMIIARMAADRMVSELRKQGHKVDLPIAIWPEVSEWIDDGLGEVGADFEAGGETILSLRLKEETKP